LILRACKVQRKKSKKHKHNNSYPQMCSRWLTIRMEEICKHR
jgi:hypothetical protein